MPLSVQSPVGPFDARARGHLRQEREVYCLRVAAVVLLLASVATAAAQAPRANRPAPAVEAGGSERPARLLRLRLPLAGNADAAYRRLLERTKSELLAESSGDTRPVIVIEFFTLGDEQDGGQGSDFARALSLARYLTSDDMAGVKTIAYLPRTVKGHAVLVALACEEIAMASTAELGQAGIDEQTDRPIEPTIIEGYRQIARARRTAPEAIAVGMVDPALEVLEVETEESIEFVERERLAEIEANRTVVRTRPLFPQGTMGLLSAREGRQIGVVKYVAASREELAGLLDINAKALAEDGALAADWRPIFYTINEPITRQMSSRSQRYLKAAIADQQANWIGLRIASGGGSLIYGQELANYVANLGGDDRRTVAYVTTEARGPAALIALACDQVVIQSTATIGGPFVEEIELDAAELQQLKRSVRGALAPSTQRTWSLLMAMVDPNIELFRYTNKQTGAERLFSPEEAGEQPDPEQWEQGEPVTRPGELLELDSDQALALGIATHVVANNFELQRVYGFASEPFEVQPTWSGEIAEALAMPWMATLLLVIAFIGVYFELHSPGLGIGGFIAALAMLLFFWSKGLGGDVGWLEVVLFVGGVIAILVEIFVVPGLGIFGLGGALMVVASLVLAGQRRLLPSNSEEMAELQQSLMVVATAGAAMVVLSFVLRRYLPNIPVLNKLMLAPPAGEELAEISYRESLAEYSHLVGQRGVTTTPLMPSGRAEFDGELVDVIAQGGAIERGTAVEVVSARGSRVVVREVS
jgi:membrane-bound serine protease (ClpP class)